MPSKVCFGCKDLYPVDMSFCPKCGRKLASPEDAKAVASSVGKIKERFHAVLRGESDGSPESIKALMDYFDMVSRGINAFGEQFVIVMKSGAEIQHNPGVLNDPHWIEEMKKCIANLALPVMLMVSGYESGSNSYVPLEESMDGILTAPIGSGPISFSVAKLFQATNEFSKSFFSYLDCGGSHGAEDVMEKRDLVSERLEKAADDLDDLLNRIRSLTAGRTSEN